MKIRFTAARAAVAASMALLPVLSLAAGAHHAVDDAVILDPGKCEVEAWGVSGSSSSGLHVGSNCRVGPVELGVAGESARRAGVSATTWGGQVKWAAPVSESLSLGLSLSPSWSARGSPSYQGMVGMGLATWKASEDLTFHGNYGREFLNGAQDRSRYGAAVEWKAADAVTLMAERYRQDGGHFARVGARWQANEKWSLDLSRANRLSGPGESSWIVGATMKFDR